MSLPSCQINVFLDSDGPVANYDEALSASKMPVDVFKHQPGTYLWLNVTPGAVEAIQELKAYDDEHLIRVWILTKTPSKSPYAYTEKILWYRRNFPWLEDRVILSHDKSLIGSTNDFLLDDRPHKAKANEFKGTFTFFDVHAPEKSWTDFVVSVLNFATDFYKTP